MTVNGAALHQSLIIDQIRISGAISRIELAAVLGYSPAAMTAGVKQLVERNVVREVGRSASTGGNRRTLLALNPDSHFALGVHADRDTARISAADMSGHLIGSTRMRADADWDTRTAARVVQEFVADLGLDLQRLAGMGVVEDRSRIGLTMQTGQTREMGQATQAARVRRESATLGVTASAATDPERAAYENSLRAATDEGARSAPVSPRSLFGFKQAMQGPSRPVQQLGARAFEEVLTALQLSHLSTIVATEVDCAAMGTLWTQRLDRRSQYALIHQATDIDSCVIAQGRVLARRIQSPSGVGHVQVRAGGAMCSCNQRGCLNAEAAPRVLLDRAKTQGSAHLLDLLSGDEKQFLGDFGTLARLAVRGEPRARTAFDRAATYMAQAVESMVCVVPVDAVYLAGPGFMDAGSIYVRAIRQHLRERSHDVPVRLVSAMRGSTALGAASLALQQFLLT